MFKQLIKRIKYLLYVSPIVLGMIGYFGVLKYSFWDSLYGTLALYFVNPTIEETNVYVVLAEFIAIIVTANFLFIVAREALGSLGHVFINRHEDATAVYGDEKYTDAYLENSTHSYLGKKHKRGNLEKAHNQIIMFEDDMTNINFLNDNAEYLADKEVFVQLNEIDSFLLGKNEGNIHYFNVYEIGARKFWKEHPISYDRLKENKSYKIALVGYDFMGKAITRFGIMNNVYFKDQCIEYHIWDIGKSGADILNGYNLMNNDKIVIHEEDIELSIDELNTMDRIILASNRNLMLVQALLYKNCRAEIYYFADGTVDLAQLFNAANLQAFGDLDQVLSEEYIRKEALLEVAKLLNYDYAKSAGYTSKDMNMDWQYLTGFVKGSNIARADHYFIEKRLMEDDIPSEEVNEIEHIRWCRYHFINNWTYAPVRDNSKRQHNLLLPYSELSQENRGKSEISDPEILKRINELI